MSKVTTLITITLLFISIILATLTYLYKNTSAGIAITQRVLQQPTQTPLSECALTISPEYKTAHVGQTESVDITIGSDGSYPTEVQLEMSYDPQALTLLQITPGNFLPNAKVLLNNIDTATGRISYVLSLPPNQKPINRSGTIATINFIPSGAKADTQILFLPKTTVYATRQTAILKQAQGADIVVSLPPNKASQSSQLNPLTQPKTTLFPTPSAK